jgi:hypothetical protein
MQKATSFSAIDSQYLSRTGAKSRDAWCVVLFYDRMAIPLARALASINVSPNAVTFASVFLCFAGLGLFLADHPWLAVLAVNAATVADCVDGKIARLNKVASAFGAKLDKWSDLIAHAVIPLVIGLSLFQDGYVFGAAQLLCLTAILARVHIKGLVGARNLIRADTGDIDKWDRWSASRRLHSEPVAEAEIAYLVPSLVVLETAYGLPPVLSVLLFCLFFVSKGVRVARVLAMRRGN